MKHIDEPDYDSYYDECCKNLEKKIKLDDEIDRIIVIITNRNSSRETAIKLVENLKLIK